MCTRCQYPSPTGTTRSTERRTAPLAHPALGGEPLRRIWHEETRHRGLLRQGAIGSWVRMRYVALRERRDREGGKALDSTMIELRSSASSTSRSSVHGQHQIPRYDEGMESFLTRGKQKAGTMKFETYATLQCVEEGRGRRLPVLTWESWTTTPMSSRPPRAGEVREAEVSLLLLDREFFSHPAWRGSRRADSDT